MKKIILITTLFAIIQTSTQAQTGGITAENLLQIKKSYANTATDKAIRNAIANNDINKLAVNAENQTKFNGDFSDKVTTKGITDQKSSGRCWLFTGLNVLRAQAIAQHKLSELQLSHNYNFFYDQLEKSNLFLQGIIETRAKSIDDRMVEWLLKNPISDGGTYTGVADLVAKYGVVPQDVMPETNSSNSTSRLSQIIALKLREFAIELRNMPANTKAADISNRKTEMLGVIYRILALNLGEPVQKFTWTRKNAEGKIIETKEYTPLSFYNELFGNDLIGNYVMLMNDPSREFYKVYEIDFDRHVYDGHNWLYVNLPIDEIKNMAVKSIKANKAMYFSCDVGKFLLREKGTLDVNNFDYESLFGTTFGMNKQQRIATFASGSSHAMSLIAVDVDENGKSKKWMVENSWGDTGYKGNLIISDEWFNEYMFRLVVEKQFVPSNILELLNQKPVRLPAWDPMFSADEN
ncbi:MAG: C1 family peptidase [Prevotellaceae bacterium]|jgi:bleomycin hydrolase|nr:C1 family peptidase [Prevotellaceae bacterium]